jgi:hypothetical protein
MNATMLFRPFLDDVVRGVIVGGEHHTARLFYENRQQGRDITADTYEALLQAGSDLLGELKQECGQAFPMIYPLKAWSLRILEATP